MGTSGGARVRSNARARGTRLVVVGVIVIGGAMASGGCSHSLFKRGVHRSQFETYDTVRNRHETDYYEDEFGRRRINLRGRLLQTE